MKCPNCGKENANNGLFCEHCGTKLESSTEPVKKNSMTFKEAISTCFHKYATFHGRAGRAEYAWWMLFCLLLQLLNIIPVAGQAILGIVAFVMLLPSIAVSVRRCHDANLSGWWALLSFTIIFNIVMLFLPSYPKENKYGSL